jgi:single-strand DNA-binding protein
MNLGTFGGRIGRDAELKQLDRGESVANFPLAISVGTKAAPSTMWVDCSIWGKRAETLAQYLTKGSKITVSGRLTLEEFKKKNGEQGYRLHCNVAEVDLHGGSSTGNSSEPSSRPAASNAPGIDDDIPF